MAADVVLRRRAGVSRRAFSFMVKQSRSWTALALQMKATGEPLAPKTRRHTPEDFVFR